MDPALFTRIADDAATVGVELIRLYAQGEPMLHPNIIDMIVYAKERGLRIHLVTNGTLFDDAQSERILNSGMDSGDRVIFSVLGYSKETHENVMRGVDHYQVVANILKFVALRKEKKQNGPVIETVFLGMDENRAETRVFRHYWRSVVDHVRTEDHISRQFAEFKSASTIPLPLRRRTCAYLWDRLLIFWNGDATVCMADVDGSYTLGNLHDTSIEEMWNCEALRAIRQIHRENRFEELPLCNNCDW
jgi:radical SAM protein with 4Fe4S-binding SPASM domain